MTKEQALEYALRLQGLALFRSVLKSKLVRLFLAVLKKVVNADEAQNKNAQEAKRVSKYAAFVAELYEQGGDFGLYLQGEIMSCETALVLQRARGMQPSGEMSACLMRELELFSQLTKISPQDLRTLIGSRVDLPLWQNTPLDFERQYSEYLAEIDKRGYGMFAKWHMFSLGAGGILQPVQNPDEQSIAQLTGYERERKQVIVNTKALMQGLPANNVLLYGDAGTGKSSTVKAVVNEYAKEGLRLVEVHKNQLGYISGIMAQLAQNPLKFIIFIDDLSFKEGNSDFTELKAILEGNVAAKPNNVVVYATSNRRHLLHESFASRHGDELHLADTMEEETSLSARFGLMITFLRPDKEQYKEIVLNLAKEQGLQVPADELLQKAEAHAIRHGGRSPRAAKQFAAYLKAMQQACGD